jgi:putative addiction module component (TIGR02574 family)
MRNAEGQSQMATSIEEITKEVVELPRHQRLALNRLLLDLDRPGKTEEIDAAWDEEIRARVAAVDDGRVEGISYEQIKQEMAARLSRR